MIGEVEQLAAGRRPSRRRDRCRRASARRAPLPGRRAPSRPSSRRRRPTAPTARAGAARHQRTARSHEPSMSALGAGVEHHVSTGFGNDVGQPIGSASSRGIRPEQRIDVRVAIGLRRLRPLDDVTAARVDDVDDAERPATSLASSTWASPCRPAAGAGRGPCRSRRRPLLRSSRRPCHIHAICLGCWKSVYAYSVRPRIWPFTCAALLRREVRDERRVQRRILLRRRLVARAFVQRRGHARRARRRNRVHGDAVAAELHRPDERHAHDARPWPRRSSSARSCRAVRPTT